MSKPHVIKHNLACECGANLRNINSVDVHCSAAGTEFDFLSHVVGGVLQDVEDVIANGVSV